MEIEKNRFYHPRFRDIVPLNRNVDPILIQFWLATMTVKKCDEIVSKNCFEFVIGISMFEINNQCNNSKYRIKLLKIKLLCLTNLTQLQKDNSDSGRI